MIDKTYICVVVIISFSLIACILVCLATLWTPKMRSKGFNVYLAAILLPDIILNISAFIIYCIQFAEDKYIEEVSLNGCAFIVMIYGYYIFCNMWTSALICHEVHMLLVKSYRAERFTPSTPLAVTKKVALVNFIACLAMITTYVIVPLFDIDTVRNACFGVETTETNISMSTIVIFSFLPLVYICYVTFDVYWRKLLPPAGKSRFVASFFLRTAIISTILTVVVTIANFMRTDIAWNIALVIQHGQGLIVGGLSMMKPDVQKTIWQIVSCQRSADESNNSTAYTINKRISKETVIVDVESNVAKSEVESPSSQ